VFVQLGFHAASTLWATVPSPNVAEYASTLSKSSIFSASFGVVPERQRAISSDHECYHATICVIRDVANWIRTHGIERFAGCNDLLSASAAFSRSGRFLD
jgi:hypothetical protein